MPISTRRKAEPKSPRISKQPIKTKKGAEKSKQTSTKSPTKSPTQHLSSVDRRSPREGLALASLPVPLEQAPKQSSRSTIRNFRNDKETRLDNSWDRPDTQRICMICICEEGFFDGSKKRCLFCGHDVSKHSGSKTFTVAGTHSTSRNERLSKGLQQQYMEAEGYMRKMTIQLQQVTELMQEAFK